MEELDTQLSDAPPIWAIFGDLMAGLVGVLVLLLVWTLGFQVDLAKSLKAETAKRQREEQRRMALERALADPLAEGRITLRDGRIGISGAVLFALNSDELQPEGRDLLQTLIAPLQVYLDTRDELLMVSGFTDDLQIKRDNPKFQDNWDLAAQRALTVTRAMIQAGMPPELVFAASFGKYHPVAPNQDEAGRTQNRRVEIALVPKGTRQEGGG